MYNFARLFVSIFGLGFFPKAPGTFASFLIIIFFYIFKDYLSNFILIVFFIITFSLSIILIDIYSKKKKIYDSPEIVIDEFLGIFLIFIFYDYIKFTNDLLMFFLIFILFRFFDILKIFPANWIDNNLKTPLGIILDDLVAGLYCIFMFILINVFT